MYKVLPLSMAFQDAVALVLLEITAWDMMVSHWSADLLNSAIAHVCFSQLCVFFGGMFV